MAAQAQRLGRAPPHHRRASHRSVRRVLLGYVEDGDDLVTMAMNGWGRAEPAWWLNLQAHPDASVLTRDGERLVRARRAEGAERERLWSRWAGIDANLEAYAARRPTETAVVVLEGRNAPGVRPRRGRDRGGIYEASQVLALNGVYRLRDGAYWWEPV